VLGRLLQVVEPDAYANVALEEALLDEAAVPTLRLWENQKSVVVGRAQVADFETDVEYCKRNCIPIVRRVTAGGTVYNGPGNLNWSYIVQREALEAMGIGAMDPGGVFQVFGGLVVSALESSGVPCTLVPPNCIETPGGKVSGMAAYLSKDRVLCHGTLLIDADLREAQALSTPRETEVPGRYPRSKPRKIANCGVRESDFVERLSRSTLEFRPGALEPREEEARKKLLGKYRRERWNLGDPFGLDDL